jgi:hypothetical protein
MDRQVWLAERRAAVIAAYDADAPAYDDHEYPTDMHPGRARAVGWIEQEGLAIADEGFKRENGWGYRHFLLRAPG